VLATIYVESPDAAARMRADLPCFTVDLQAAGYREVLVRAEELSALPEETAGCAERLATGLPESMHLVDTEA
jgi:hypothetical protein